jgi:hypothetical protein
VSARRHDGEHLRVGGLDHTRRGMVLTSLATALGVPTRILSTRHSHTPDMRWVATACGEWRSFELIHLQPTSMRAIRARYDPYEQTRGRVDQLRGLGHSVDKVEIM